MLFVLGEGFQPGVHPHILGIHLSIWRGTIKQGYQYQGKIYLYIIYICILASVWPSARHNDYSRETLQCGCNLCRSLVVLPLAFPLEQLRRRPSACDREMNNLFNTLNKPLPWQSSKALEGQLLCYYCVCSARNCVV